MFLGKLFSESHFWTFFLSIFNFSKILCPKKTRNLSTTGGTFFTLLFQKYLHGCRKISHFYPHTHAIYYIIYLLKDPLRSFCDEIFQHIYVYMRQIYVRFPKIFTISPNECAVRTIPITIVGH